MRIPTLTAVALLIGAPLHAQEPAVPQGPELVDRVVAVVGDTVLLLSDVRTELERLQAAGAPIPEDPALREEFARDVLDQQVDNLILSQAAREEGIQVPAQEVDEAVEQEVRNIRRRFGNSEIELQRALAQTGLTLEQYRLQLAAQYRDQRMIETFLSLRMRNRARPLVSEEQIREAFEAERGNLGARPATLSLQQVMVKAEPSEAARATARQTAEQVVRELAAGGDFQVLARRFSDDPASKEHGGDLGWFKAGAMVPEFERAAFALRPGQTSGIVESDFGYHIIRVEKVRGPERQARHILIRPEIGEADLTRASQRADSVATAIREGASAVVLARRSGTPESEIEISRIPVDRLPPVYEAALEDAQPGDVVGPIELQNPTGATVWSVLRVVERQDTGAYTLEDLRDPLIQRIQQERIIRELLSELRDRFHVAILQ